MIDNFMRLGFVKDDYVRQAECATALSAMAMELEVHIHLVVHQNKNEGHRGQAGGKRSISGSFEIIAIAHKIVEVQRDLNKGEKVSEGFQNHKIGRINDEEKVQRLKALNEVPDGNFILHAQRRGEQQNASKYLWFLWESQQYVRHPQGHPDHKSWRFMDKAPPRRIVGRPTAICPPARRWAVKTWPDVGGDALSAVLNRARRSFINHAARAPSGQTSCAGGAKAVRRCRK